MCRTRAGSGAERRARRPDAVAMRVLWCGGVLVASGRAVVVMVALRVVADLWG